MGIRHSTCRFFGHTTTQDDNHQDGTAYTERLIYAQYYYGPSSQRLLPKIFSFIRSLFTRAWKALFNKADPILPIQTPEPSRISSSSSRDTKHRQRDKAAIASSQQLPKRIHSANRNKIDDVVVPIPIQNQEPSRSSSDQKHRQRDKAVAASSQQSHSENRIKIDNGVVSIPEFTRSFAHKCASRGIPGSAREAEKEKVMIKSITTVDEGRWMQHYNSRHRMLLVGEGDFSFSACLAVAFVSASNMIATSLNSKDFLKENYQNALSNIEKIRSRQGKVMHGIDATTMADHSLLGRLKFDRIIFNFPFAGFASKQMPQERAIRFHRELVLGFLQNARQMISENGEIHVTHKTNGFHIDWNIGAMGSSEGLGLIEAVKFNHRDYPGYSTKCGFGGNKYFKCNPSKTYKFGQQKVPYGPKNVEKSYLYT